MSGHIKGIFYKQNRTLPNKMTACGYSRSAYRTGIHFPELDMLADAGPQFHGKVSRIFITHTHGDHIAELPFTLIGDESGDHVVDIYVHKDAVPHIHTYIAALFTTNAMSYTVDTTSWYRLHGVLPGDVIKNLDMNGRTYDVEVFECDHGIPTVSYGFVEIKKKLREDYLNMKGKEIGELRKKGVNIYREVRHKSLAYVCDTTINVLVKHPDILLYDVVFIECTFLYLDEADMALKKKHVCWEHLREYVIKNEGTNFVLFHFSQKYKDDEIEKFFDKEKEDYGINNVMCWI